MQARLIVSFFTKRTRKVIRVHEPVLLGYRVINDDGGTIYASLVIRAAGKLNQRKPNVLAGDRFGEEWGGYFNGKIGRLFQELIERLVNVRFSR